MSKNNVVYKLLCNNRDASYVGQTKRQVKTKIKEHINNRKLVPSRHSVITEHILEFKHSFGWKNIKILDYEPNYNKILISEMLHIKKQRHNVNSQKDTECLDDSYFCLLSAISNDVNWHLSLCLPFGLLHLKQYQVLDRTARGSFPGIENGRGKK